ncbi:MAG: 4Fe-4S cluster-binding domain-containing protein [Candidatus Aminicenantes bacterium]|nr:4Fe-4S cluster-binding domain-containing protein [Candidatus Aminicenantes bacterium]
MKGVHYQGLGDLSRHDVVSMAVRPYSPGENYQTEDGLLIHLTVTGRCYARCKGCINTAVTLGSDLPRSDLDIFQETAPERDCEIILGLTRRHPQKTMTLCFYGGEPFLCIEKMVEVWKRLKDTDEAERIRFLVYTNGEKISENLQRYHDFMKDIWLYSISIDGDEKQHNSIRLGTRLSRIHKNLDDLSGFYSGYVLHWSTLREEQSLKICFDEFMRLYERGWVNQIFWHWAESRESFIEFSRYAERYGKELEEIMNAYVNELQKGRLLPIIHINELVLYLISGRSRGHTACGVEMKKNYDVVSGEVFPCADLPSSHSIGGLDKNGKLKLKEYDLKSLVAYKVDLGCGDCGVHAYCGGRCPVQVLAGSMERTLQYCQLMRLHVGIVQQHIEKIIESFHAHGITLQDVYDRSGFLAKYTDVVP